jgi:hypothetical protein
MPWILDTKYLFANGTMLKKAGVSPSDLKTWNGVLTAVPVLPVRGAEHRHPRRRVEEHLAGGLLPAGRPDDDPA